jgi:dethiobiotin synthetase
MGVISPAEQKPLEDE